MPKGETSARRASVAVVRAALVEQKRPAAGAPERAPMPAMVAMVPV